MPASNIDIAALAAAAGVTEDEMTWLLKQLCPYGVGGAQLQAVDAPLALANDALSGIGLSEDYVAFADLTGGNRSATFLPIAGCETSYTRVGTAETLTFTMGASSITLSLDPGSDTVHIDTVATVFDYVRNQLINRRRV